MYDRETLKQLTDFRWRGQDCEGFNVPFNAFRTASEVCELWLVPEKNGEAHEKLLHVSSSVLRVPRANCPLARCGRW